LPGRTIKSRPPTSDPWNSEINRSASAATSISTCAQIKNRETRRNNLIFALTSHEAVAPRPPVVVHDDLRRRDRRDLGEERNDVVVAVACA